MKQLEDYLQQHPKKHLIFDFDETLFILHLPWHILLAELPKRLAKLDPELTRQGHRSVTELANRFVNKHGSRATAIIYPYCEQFEMSYLEKLSVNHELLEFIRRNAGHYTYSIWSSNMYTTITTHLLHHGVYHYFSEIVTRDRVRLTKPYADGFTHIYRPDQRDKSDYLMIGDSIYDEHAARDSGIDYLKVVLRPNV